MGRWLWLVVPLLPGCGSLTFYTVTVSTDLTDEAGATIREQGFEVCADAVFDDGEVVELGCDRAFGDFDGRGEASFSITDGRVLQDVRVTASLDGTPLTGAVASVQVGPVQLPESIVDVDVAAAFTAPRSLLPERITRFRLVGSVIGDRAEGIPDATGTISIDISFDGGETVEFTGTGPVTTDFRAVYAADIDVVSNFDFPVSKDIVTNRIDIDGYQGERVDFVLEGVEGSDPRSVIAFSSF